MTASDIILVILSGLGVFHGLVVAIVLGFFPKGNRLSNISLSLLLLVLSFRIGKSIFLEFAQDIDVKLIFTGLGSMMIIGPLFYLFVRSATNKSFRFRPSFMVHFVPAAFGIGFGLWLEQDHLSLLPKWFFAIIFISYYLHFLAYLLVSRRFTRKERHEGLNENTYQLLTLMYYGLLVIWVAYVLNLFDDTVPYIIGPILYSIAAYTITIRVIQKGYFNKLEQRKYSTTPLSTQRREQVYQKVIELVESEGQYKDADISLKRLAEQLKVSNQTLSMVINQESHQNFNTFINRYRIEDAKRRLVDPESQHLTIASIAYDVGFSSLSSFNSAFKQFTQKTPAAFKKEMMK